MKQYCYHILYLPARGSFSGILHVCHFGTYLYQDTSKQKNLFNR
jgi:hypothetical protein